MRTEASVAHFVVSPYALWLPDLKTMVSIRYSSGRSAYDIRPAMPGRTFRPPFVRRSPRTRRHCSRRSRTSKRWENDRYAITSLPRRHGAPVPYFHVVYTLPAPIADLAYHNKAVIYDILFRASAEATLTIAADKKRLGARVGITSVLHTWGSAMTHHPHVHMIVPGGGLSDDGERWIACRPEFFLPVRVLSRLFRRLVIEMLLAAHDAGKLAFFGAHAALNAADPFAAFLAPLGRSEWVVYAKRPFGGPEAVLAYLSRYTHRVAISNRRLVAADASTVTFKYKDYRVDGPGRFKVMMLATGEFIRRFLSHVLPKGFHRIRHYGMLANGQRTDSLAKARELLAVPAPVAEPEPGQHESDTKQVHPRACPCCGSRMLVIEVFARGSQPSWRSAGGPRPTSVVSRIDTS
jgi:Putative transposase